LSAADDDEVRLWRPDGCELTRFTEGDERLVAYSCAIAFAADGRGLVVSSAGKELLLWAPDGQLLRRFRGHEGNIATCAIAFSPVGEALIVTAADDKTAKLWREDGDCVATLDAHKEPLTSCSLCFDADGTAHIITASHDASVVLWRYEPASSNEDSHAPQACARLLPEWDAVIDLRLRSGRDYLWMAPGSPLWRRLLLEKYTTHGSAVECFLAASVLDTLDAQQVAQVRNFPDAWK
jgi:WD40 repeat protein